MSEGVDTVASTAASARKDLMANDLHDGVPLKPVIEPGEYRVAWRFPAKDRSISQVQGDVELEADRPPRGSAFGEIPHEYTVQPGGGRYSTWPQEYDVPVMTGVLLSGMTVTLIDVRIIVWIDGRAIIQARAAIVGMVVEEVQQPLAIASARVQIEGLDVISATGPLERFRTPLKKEHGDLEMKWSVEARVTRDQEWRDADVAITHEWLISYTFPEGYFFRISTSPVVTITPIGGIAFDQLFERWIEPLRRIVSLSTRRQDKITSLDISLLAADGKTTRPLAVFGTALHHEPYASRRNDLVRVEPEFRVGPDDEDLLSLLRSWQELESDHHPLLETYGSMMFAPRQHPRSAVLLLLQALEGAHGYNTKDQYANRLSEHTEKRGATLEAISKAIKGAPLNFVKKHLARKPHAGLDQTLEAAFKNHSTDLMPALHATALIKQVKDQTTAKTAFDALRIVRNDLAHGNRGYNADDLHDVAELLDQIVRDQMLAALGVTRVDTPDEHGVRDGNES